MTHFAHDAATIIHQRIKAFTPKLAVILGSGLGELAESIHPATVIPYSDLPGFHTTTVAGHHGNLYLGTIQNIPVACLQGRPHYYEGTNNITIKTMIRTLKLI